MPFHKIEVDDEVWAFLQTRAQPFIDTPNDVLKRELPIRGPRRKPVLVPKARTAEVGGQPSSLPSFPMGTPEALRQILSVIWMIKRLGNSRQEATNIVAQGLRVTPQTVLDKYTRQLGLRADQFDVMLQQGGMTQARDVLTSRFPSRKEIIDCIFAGLSNGLQEELPETVQ